jgi:3-phenylpropionate/trans-cinnamate dioxygenase ferredoxin component
VEPVHDVGGGAPADGDVLSGWIDIGPASELGEGVPLPAEVDGVAVVVVRCGRELYAVEDRCTHDGESFSGAQVESCELICPRHGARFDLRTGDALTPPAYEPVRTYAAREADGRILVESPA